MSDYPQARVPSPVVSPSSTDLARPPCVENRIAVLEGARGWLASWVLFNHVLFYCAAFSGLSQQPLLIQILLKFLYNGRTAVWIFMILSGFVNFYLLDGRGEKPLVYLTRRFLRLYPVYALLFFLSLFINHLNLYALRNVSWSGDVWLQNQITVTEAAYRYITYNCVSHIFLLHGLVPSWSWLHATCAFLGVDWSISTEWQFYLLAPLLYAWSRKKYGLIVLGLLSIFCLWSPTIGALTPFQNDNFSFLLFKGHLFYIGMVSCLFYRHLFPKHDSDKWPAWLLCSVGFFVLYLLLHDPSILFWTGLFLLAVVLSKGSYRVLNFFAWPFTNPWAQYLGQISYSIYLSHWLVIMVLLRLLLVCKPGISNTEAALYLFPATFVLTVVASHFLYQYVEKPCIRFGKQLFKK